MTSERPRQLGARSKALLAACVSLALVAALLVAAEAAVRVIQWYRTGTTFTVDTMYRNDPDTGLRLLVPNYSASGVTINEHGFRSPSIALEKPPGVLRIAFLGGSTTFCAEASGLDQTWPALVMAGLSERFPERRFDWLNAAVPGYDTEASLDVFRQRVAAFDPDVVFVYHGTNDLSYDSRELAKREGLFGGRAEPNDWFYRNSLLWNLIVKNLRILALQAEQTEGSKPTLSFDPVALRAPFESRLRSLIDETAAVADAVVVLTFSHKFRHEQTRDEQVAAADTSLYYMPYMSVDGLLLAFDAYNDAIRDVAGARSAILVDGEHDIPGDDEHFNDSVHLTDAGNLRMAERVLARLERSEAFREIVATDETRP